MWPGILVHGIKAQHRLLHAQEAVYCFDLELTLTQYGHMDGTTPSALQHGNQKSTTAQRHSGFTIFDVIRNRLEDRSDSRRRQVTRVSDCRPSRITRDRRRIKVEFESDYEWRKLLGR